MPTLTKLMNSDARDGRLAWRCGRVPHRGIQAVWCRVDRGNRRRGMEYRSLGRSGLKVSPLCLGTMMFGGATDEATAARIVARARGSGASTSSTPPTPTMAASRRRWWAERSASTGRGGCWRRNAPIRRGPGEPGPERAGSVAASCAARGGGEPAAAGRRGDRRAVSAQGRSCDAAGGDGARAGRSDPGGQDPLFRGFQLPELAGRRDLPAVRRGRDRPAGGESAAVQRPEPRG